MITHYAQPQSDEKPNNDAQQQSVNGDEKPPGDDTSSHVQPQSDENLNDTAEHSVNGDEKPPVGDNNSHYVQPQSDEKPNSDAQSVNGDDNCSDVNAAM